MKKILTLSFVLISIILNSQTLIKLKQLETAAGASQTIMSGAGGVPTWSIFPSWNITGNAVSTNTNFIGTTTNRSFFLNTNNITRLKLDSLGALRLFTTTSTPTVNGSFYYDGGQSGANGFNFYSNDPSDLSFLFKFGNSHNSLSYYADHTVNNWLAVPAGQNINFSVDAANSTVYGIDPTGFQSWTTLSNTVATGATSQFRFTGGSPTNQSIGTEQSVFIVGGTTTGYATGTRASHRASRFGQATVSFAVPGGTLTEGSSLGVDGVITVTGAGGYITNANGISVGLISPAVLTASVTNAYGLSIKASTGAQNNYAARFLSGNVGIGTSTPSFSLDVTGTGRFTSTLNTTGITNTGNITLTTAGNGITIKNGTNASVGTVTLSSASAVITNTNLTITSVLIPVLTGTGTAIPLIITKAAGSFTITSTNPTDNRAVDYFIIQQN